MNHVELVTSTPSDFRTFMAGFPSGVSIVTSLDDTARPWGMTCSALCSVTVEPPTLLVGMRAESPTLKAVLQSGAFAVNLLHADGRGTAELFASGDPDRFDTTTWRLPPGAGGPHLVRDAHAVADCRVGQVVPVGGQRMVFGEVVRITELSDAPPLLYGRRQFSTWPA
ncbi:flavin reductase (DIM6/NTAB) family NADH-FMN oxidoreductase RutF [Kitasatospora sp. MAA19]|nr:flavin reductase (DIM6/NTAB) family NADH-FMN oxidoreductase RutF [Kitasatospora sp. MAA19]